MVTRRGQSTLAPVAAAISLAACNDALPKLHRVVPPEGLLDRTTLVVLEGSALDPDVREGSGGVETIPWQGHVGPARLLAVAYVSTGRLEALVPAGLPPGIHPLVLTSGSRTVHRQEAFIAVTPVAPRIDRAVPPRVPAGGGIFELQGIGFHLGSVVSLRGEAVPFERLSNGVVRIVAPPASPGPARVEVRSPVGEAWREDLVRYLP